MTLIPVAILGLLIWPGTAWSGETSTEISIHMYIEPRAEWVIPVPVRNIIGTRAEAKVIPLHIYNIETRTESVTPEAPEEAEVSGAEIDPAEEVELEQLLQGLSNSQATLTYMRATLASTITQPALFSSGMIVEDCRIRQVTSLRRSGRCSARGFWSGPVMINLGHLSQPARLS